MNSEQIEENNRGERQMRFVSIKKSALLALLLLILFSAVSCRNTGSSQNSNTSVSDTTSTGTSLNDAEKKKQYIEDYELIKTDGTKEKLSSLAKENTLLVFWATWCRYCVSEIPILEELAKEYDNLSIVMINTGDNKDTVAEFETKNSMTLTSFYDEQSVIARQLGITGFPTIVFLSEDLEFISYISGKMEKENFEEAFKKIKEFRTERGDFN